MKHVYRLSIILGISFLGELLNRWIPLPIPASIYGLVLMLAGSFTSGASMWAVSTIAGALVLVVKYYQEKRAADEARAEEEERQYQQKLKAEAKEGRN